MSFWTQKSPCFVAENPAPSEAPGIFPQITGCTWPVMYALASWLQLMMFHVGYHRAIGDSEPAL